MSAPTPDLGAAAIEARTALASDVRELIDGYCPDIPMCPRCQAREGEVLVLADTYAVAAAQTSVTMAEQLDATKTVLQETSRESSQRGEQLRLAREDRDQLRKQDRRAAVMTRRVLCGVGIAVTGLALLYAVAFVMGAPA